MEKSLPRFRLIFFLKMISLLIFSFSLSAASVLESLPAGLEAEKYLAIWETAFRKVMVDKSDIARLKETISEDPVNPVERDHMLEVARISSLRSFMHELNGRLDGTRKALTAEERVVQIGRGSPAHLAALTESYREDRLTPEELAVVIHFYRWIDQKNANLIEENGLQKSHTETARQANEATAWPAIEIRRHEQDAPRVPYTDAMSSQWTRIFKFFRMLQLEHSFRQLWSQLVNFEAGHLKYRHLETFEERFLLNIRRLALVENQELIARDLLLAYFSNTKSGTSLHQQLELLPDESPSDSVNSKTLGWFAFRISTMRDVASIREFFEKGVLPKHFLPVKSKLAEGVIEIFGKAHVIESQNGCATRIKVLADQKASGL